MLVATLLAFVLGLTCLIKGIHVLRKGGRERATGSFASGVVVELKERVTPRGSPVYNPVVKYTTANGAVVRFEAGVGTNPPRHQVGTTVAVLYDPATPESARIDPASHWQLAGPYLAFGIVGLVLGALLLWLRQQAS